MPKKQTHVFVSYSHADTELVAPLVKLLRVNQSLVFQDIDGIQPGKKWQDEIDTALGNSHLVVVFWCDHANRSDEVSKEWKAALAYKKDLLPLLLDPTPLPQELSEFQWIDFREMVAAIHPPGLPVGDYHKRLSPAPPKAMLSRKATVWAYVILLLIVLFFVTLWNYDEMGMDGINFIPLFLISAVVVVIIWSILKMLPLLRKQDQFVSDVVRIADELEAEILRRTASMSVGDA